MNDFVKSIKEEKLKSHSKKQGFQESELNGNELEPPLRKIMNN